MKIYFGNDYIYSESMHRLFEQNTTKNHSCCPNNHRLQSQNAIYMAGITTDEKWMSL